MNKFQPDISIRNKIILFLSLLFIIGSLLNYILLQKIVFPNFVKLEDHEASCQIKRVENAIKDIRDNIDTLCQKWSIWDDAYFYMENLNPGFKTSNLENSSMNNSSINVMIFFDIRGEVFYANEIDLETGRPVAEPGFPMKHIPLELFNLLTTFGAGSLAEARVAGIHTVDDKIYILSCRPILTSDGLGPASGYLLMAKLLTSSLKAELQKKIHADFIIHQGGKDHTCRLSSNAYRSVDQSVYLEPVDSSLLYALSEVAGINGQPALTIRIAMARTITGQGEKTIRTTVLATLVLGCLSLCLIITIYNLLIHRPLKTLRQHARKITYESDFGRRLDVQVDYRNDEIGDLAREFNDMLDTLEFTYAQLDDINEQQKLEIVRREKLENELIIIQEKLEKLAAVDGLTQLANRRFFDEEFSRQWRLHFRQQRPLAIVLCDVDHFKLYNDTYGHPAGDKCLKILAGVLTESARRPSDLAARYGGEEFVVLLPETPRGGAEIVAEKIRASVEECNIEHKASPVARHVTLSLGVISFIPQVEMKPEELIDLVDKALYQAKEEGRNRVIVKNIPDE